MSRSLPRLISSLLLSAAAFAQVNPFVIYPQDPERQTMTCTSYVGRPDLANAAEALVAIDTQHLRGVGDANGAMRIFGVYQWAADEKLSTSESYDIVIRGATPAGAPDMTPAGQLLRVSGLSTPPSSSTQRGTWIQYDGFGLTGGYFFASAPSLVFVGVSLPANPLWPATDGQALHRADMLTANTGATRGENHRAGAVSQTWSCPPNAAPSRTPWSYILGPFVTSPNLHMGGEDPTSNRLGAGGAGYGLNGLYPDVSRQPRNDGLRLRVTDNISPIAFVFVGMARGFQPAYYWTGMGSNMIGLSHIGDEVANQPVSLGFVLMYNGACEMMLAFPNTIPLNINGRNIVFQAAVLDPYLARGEWSNAQVAHF